MRYWRLFMGLIQLLLLLIFIHLTNLWEPMMITAALVFAYHFMKAAFFKESKEEIK